VLFGTHGIAWAAEAQEPVSVGDRFKTEHQAQGLAIGGFEVRAGAELRAGHDDNITWSTVNAPSSSLIELRGSAEATQQSGPYALSGSAMLKHTFYPDASGHNLTEVNLRAGVSVDLAPELVFRAAAAYVQGAETGLTNGIVVNDVFEPYAARAEFQRVPLGAELEYHRGRVELRGGVRVEAAHYDTQTTQSGMRVVQDFRNGWEGEATLRASYEAHPHLAAFVEVREGSRRYDDSNGDSDTWRAVVGGSVEITRLLIGEAHIGYGGQSLPNGGESDGLVFGANLNWFVMPLLSLTLNASREFRAEVDVGALGATSAVAVTQDAVSLRGEWEPVRRLLLYGQARYAREGRDTTDRSDELLSLIAGAAYVLSNNVSLELEYEREDGTSNFSGDFERNHVTLGLAAAY
jgi:hypothetical protein